MDPNLKPNLPAVPPSPAGPAPLAPPTPSAGRDVVTPPGIYPTAPDTRLPIPPQTAPGQPLPPMYAPQPPAGPPKKRREGLRSIISTITLLILAPLIALAITAFAFQSYQVEGASMETSLSNNDRLIVNKLPRTWARLTKGSYIPKRGDVIIFNQAGLYDSAGNAQKQLIKRVIGLPGERVVVKDGTVTVFSSEHPDGFNPDNAGIYSISAASTPGDVNASVETAEVFVLGDNRGNSEDSRYFGPIAVDNIVGKLTFRIAPIDKIQKF